ncbi:MAG: flagellar basal body-associated FliL family protein [Eubacteriales bacterium]|nr:flagellar basal body-associated FliL family protein [Eubacteriales bacterium]
MAKKIIIIIVVLLLLLGAAVGAYFLIRANKEKGLAIIYYSPGDAFVTNIYGTDYLVKLNVNLAIRLVNQEKMAEINNVVRDTILRTMRSQPQEMFETAETLQEMADLIQKNVNTLFPKESADEEDVVLRVYFTEFVTQ